jgi:S1-C subfamily serine protease/tetratricopeptide (TPR) repeat protein
MKTSSLLLSTLLLTHTLPAAALPKSKNVPAAIPKPSTAAANDSELPKPKSQDLEQAAQKITVRVTTDNNGGSGVLIARSRKDSSYLVLTSAHIAKRGKQFQIQAPDGQKYVAKQIDGGFDQKSDLALLKFTSKKTYRLADLTDVGSPLAPKREIYSAGFPFDSKDIRITSGQVSQLSDIPFDDGTQIGYTIQGKKGIRQGMSGGAILDIRGKLLGINTRSAAPILANYTYSDGSKPSSKLAAGYSKANWGVPAYNFLTRVKPDILDKYDDKDEGLPQDIEHQVTPTGYLAKLNKKARQMTVRMETAAGSGSGVIVAKEGKSYYVLTAKHVVQPEATPENTKPQNYADIKTITYDQEQHPAASVVVDAGSDLAVVKFSSGNAYTSAQLAAYGQNNGDLVFVGGFPGRENIKSPLWQWQLNPGYAQDSEQGKLNTQDDQSFSNGYDLLYSSISYGGMSGGSVLDVDGNLLGIHGRAESTDNAMLGQSVGISNSTLMGLLTKLRIKPQVAKNKPTELNPAARSTVETAMKNIPEPQAGSSGERWLTYGNQLYRTGGYSKSASAFNKAVIKGETLRGSYGVSLSLFALRKLEQANIAIDQAIAAIPANKRASYYYFWKKKSTILRNAGQYDASLQAIDQAIRLKPNAPMVLNERGGVLGNMKQYKAAIAIYDQIIKMQPGAIAYSNRGNAKYALGDKQGAISDFNQAISLNPKYAKTYSNRGNAKYALGDKQGAISDFNQAISLNPKDEKAYFNRGNAKYALGDKQGAINDFTKASELFRQQGNMKLYQLAIQRIKKLQES